MAYFKSFVVDNVIGPIEATLLSERKYLQRQTERALETIGGPPQASICEIYQSSNKII